MVAASFNNVSNERVASFRATGTAPYLPLNTVAIPPRASGAPFWMVSSPKISSGNSSNRMSAGLRVDVVVSSSESRDVSADDHSVVRREIKRPSFSGCVSELVNLSDASSENSPNLLLNDPIVDVVSASSGPGNVSDDDDVDSSLCSDCASVFWYPSVSAVSSTHICSLSSISSELPRSNGICKELVRLLLRTLITSTIGSATAMGMKTAQIMYTTINPDATIFRFMLVAVVLVISRVVLVT